MRQFTTLLLCLAAFSCAPAQEATLAKQTPDNISFKQVVYENPATHATITLTGIDTLVYQADGKKRAGKYTIENTTMHVGWNADAQSGAPNSADMDYSVRGEGVLLYEALDESSIFLSKDATEKEKEKALETLCLSHAKQIALACRLYASDNNGNYPVKLEDLLPTYLQDRGLFISPLSAKKEAMGFDYFGFGGNLSDDPNRILLLSRDMTPDGKRIVIYYDSSGEIKADK